jgi:two-component system, OmpR family, response regulator
MHSARATHQLHSFIGAAGGKGRSGMSSATAFTALLVEDDAAFADELAEFLARHGVACHWLASLGEVLAWVDEIAPDIVVLDQFIGGHDSITILRDLRAGFQGGIVMLTGNQDMTDRIVALECGADDFVSKLAGPRELHARLRAVLRRTGPNLVAQTRDARAADPLVTAWRIDKATGQLQAPGGGFVPLSKGLLAALLLLARNRGRTVTREELSLHLMGRSQVPGDRSVDNLVSQLRRRLEHLLPGEKVIRSVRGEGYVFLPFSLPPSAAGGRDGP